MPHDPPAVEPAVLTDDEIAVLALLAEGRLTASVAVELHLSERSVRRRVRVICQRLNVDTPIEAVVWAARRGLV
ncbi:LuxR family transcriptional regulator [Micromonospora qiuiae]|uniref:LuxR family transcriptional regulator n=1 Tax=Micromonospora qiuiae TaxID=502268 RepID=A0ABQ4JFA8_9ACTN|nr:LuxR C-terminal-related transcriptional regulator [Micromonospora qiuiae]GIJ28975.1 LuxR family transcriptional regulator [Micromonospora qiuiae]